MVYPALLPLMRTSRLPVFDWTDAPADLNGLVCLAERRNLVSARVPSRFKRSLHSFGLRWWQHVTVRDLHQHCIAAEVIGPRRTSLIPRVRLCSIMFLVSYHSLPTVHKTISDQNQFWCDNQSSSTAHVYTCRNIYTYVVNQQTHTDKIWCFIYY